MLVPDELPMLVLFDGWTSFFRDRWCRGASAWRSRLRSQLEESVLPRFIGSSAGTRRRASRSPRRRSPTTSIWDVGGLSWLLTFFESRTLYFLPLALAWRGRGARAPARAVDHRAACGQQANVGVIGDAMADEGFCRNVVKAVCGCKSLQPRTGELRFARTSPARS
jgi:maltose alpha-D-glucosyltransferase/alpha-amylase